MPFIGQLDNLKDINPSIKSGPLLLRSPVPLSLSTATTSGIIQRMKTSAFFLLLCFGTGHAALTVGQRVWIALDSPLLVDDGYASGVLLALDAEHAEIEIRALEERGARTLAGSCGGDTLPPAVVSGEPYRVHTQRVPLPLIEAYREGNSRFLQREQLGVRFQRWADQAPGLNLVSLDNAVALAEAFADEPSATAFEMMATLRRARSPFGFTEPADGRADALLSAAQELTDSAMLHPEHLHAAMQQKPTTLLGRTLVLVFERLLEDYQDLSPDTHPTARSVLRELLRQWATGDGQWKMVTGLRLRLH